MNAKTKALHKKTGIKFYLIRHGAAENEETKEGGWDETPLEKEGIEQAEKISIPKDVKGLVTSDLKRAIETAEIIKKDDDIPILEKSKALRAWNTGEYEGKEPKKVEPILEDLAQKHPDEKIPDGESFNQYKKRLLTGLQEILKKYNKTLGIITHSQGTRIIRAWEKKGCPSDLSINMKDYAEKSIKNGGVEEVYMSTEN